MLAAVKLTSATRQNLWRLTFIRTLVLAADELHYNQIALRAEVSQEVARDKMIVTLYTESQNSDPAKLAAEITTTLNKALDQAREVKGVTLRQGSRNSYPISVN
jgi:predicted secreted protein